MEKMTLHDHGAFAPHSKTRSKIVEGKVGKETPAPDAIGEKKAKSEFSLSWAKLLNRVFKVAVTKCQFCHGKGQSFGVVDDLAIAQREGAGPLGSPFGQVVSRVGVGRPAQFVAA